MKKKFLILDFGSKSIPNLTFQVTKRGFLYRVITAESLYDSVKSGNYAGVIMSGSDNTCYEEGTPKFDSRILELGVPVLGICYGAQAMALALGKKVARAEVSELEPKKARLYPSKLFFGLNSEETVPMRHYDRVYEVPDGFKLTAKTADCPIAAYSNEEIDAYGVQFHPEWDKDRLTQIIFDNFIYKICNK